MSSPVADGNAEAGADARVPVPPEPGDAAPRAARIPAWRLWLRRLLPWAITGVVVFFILREYPLAKILAELERGHAAPMMPVGLIATVAVLFVVALWDTMVIRAFFGRPRYWDVLRGKAGTSMLLTLGYGFGHGGYGVWIARATGAKVAEAVGIALYITASDLCALCLIATASIFLGGAEVPRALAIMAPCLGGLLLAFVALGPYRLLGEPPRVFAPWSKIPRMTGLVSILGRAGHITALILSAWLAARVFGLDIPVLAALSYLPVIILVGSLPINVAGFGPVQGMWVLFFRDFADGPAILAFQFLYHLALGLGLVIRGAPFLRRVITEIETGAVRPS
jgi:hypothetical protein